jgi:RecB family exonuclease
LKVHFGQWLDGYIPRLPVGEAVMGEVWVGPGGLLGLLETALGIDGQAAAEPERVGAYSQRIERCVDGEAFYSQSWEVDPWGVARKLLSWRDELVMVGWDGSAVVDGGPRLDALAMLEAESGVLLPAGFADRLRRVEKELAGGRCSGIEELHLVEPRAHLPRAWQRVVGALEGTETKVFEPAALAPAADPGTDLGLLQAALVGGITLEAGRVRGDGSLLLVTDRSPWEAAEGLAAWLRQLEPGAWPLEQVVVRGAAPVVLDEALARYGVPTLGAASFSSWRPALQVMPLMLSLLWAPRDPQRMFELLSLPVSPLSRSLRTALVRALGRAPGVGGATWTEAWHEAAAAAEDPAGVECQVRDWLERLVFDPSGGVPAGEVRKIAEQVGDWARTRASSADEEEAATLETAAAQARQLSQILDGWGDERIERTQLDQLLRDVTRAGSARRVHDGISGAVPCVWHPGAVLGAFDTVVWWGFVASAAGPAERPVWRATERRALAAAGVEVDEPAARQRARTAAWIRPLLAARKRAVLVAFETLDGEEEALHPVWDEIGGRLRLRDKDVVALTGDWRYAPPLGRGSTPIVLPERAHEVVPAAAGRAVWRVDATLLPPRSKESASSLDSLLGCPLRWALRYRADLRPEGVAALPDGNLLFGMLAHGLIESFLLEDRDALPEPADARRLIEERFNEAVEAEAAALLQPGMTETMQRVRYKTARAGAVLVAAITGGGYRVEGCEVEVPGGTFAGGGLSGFADLLLSHPEHGTVVVDLKWGGWSFRKKLLEQGHALQLAVYAHAFRKGSGLLPPTAFFILSEARFLTLYRGLFEPAVVVEGPTMEETLAAAEETFGEVRMELEAGELVAPPLLEEASPQAERRADYPLELEPPCRFCDFGGICGVALEEQA